MGAVVGGERQPLDRPGLAVGQVAGCEAGKERQELAYRLVMVEVGNLGLEAGRIGVDAALKRDRDVDQAARQGQALGTKM
jgi:hypothetical protein